MRQDLIPILVSIAVLCLTTLTLHGDTVVLGDVTQEYRLNDEALFFVDSEGTLADYGSDRTPMTVAEVDIARDFEDINNRTGRGAAWMASNATVAEWGQYFDPIEFEVFELVDETVAEMQRTVPVVSTAQETADGPY
jgi:hypothetical protein